ncbi:MAG TPA: diguanylate cyclase, partial [Burkholderiaceae bacterium]
GAAVGTNNGVLLLDRAGRVVARHAQPRNIWAMDVQGRRLWLGSQKDGLWALDLDRPAAAPVRADLDLGEIDAVGPRLDGRLLVGTPNGLQWLDEDGSAHPVSIRNGGVDTPTGWVAAIAAGPRGRIWVSTNNGLYVLRREGAAGAFRSRHFGLREGLPSAVVDMVLFDAAGDAWVSTDGGIVAMSGKTFAMHVYDGKDGVAILEYWANSGAVAADGSLLFGAKRGLTVIRPEALRPWADLPPTVVTSMRIGDQPRRAGAFAADGSPALTIPPQANTFEVEFSSLDYSMPALNRYRYRLDGNDEHWIATDATHRVAAYSHLPPGDYVLHLQGSNRLGAWGRELALPVRVLPAWYQTWWFRATAAAGLLGAALMLHVLLTWRLRRNRAALERAVWLRTQEVVQQKDEVLRQKEEVLRQKELVDDKARQLDEKARQLEQANEMLERISVTDPLTGLHNRRYLTQNIDSDIAQSLRRHERGDTGGANADLVFFMIDLDHFKAVNDVYGHAAGDAVLKEVARRLQQVARKTDHLVRWGGEEFLLVARDTHRSLAPLIAERIRQVIREWPFELPEIELGKTCSVGYACYPFLQAHPRLLGWEEVAEIADQALYLAKHGGRDTWVGLQPTERLAATSVRQAVTATTDCLADGRLRRELPGDARPAVVAVAEPPDRRGRRREDVRG